MSRAGWLQGTGLAAVAGCLGLAVVCGAALGAAQMQLGSGSGQTGSQLGSQTGSQTGAQTGARQTVGNTSVLGANGALDSIASPFPDNGRQKRNDDRQRRLVMDTLRLLTLTTQLKAEVANTGAETMSPEMLKQMEEIEKLAKSVKDKMRD